MAFDYDAFRRAFEAKDVGAWLAFYADGAEWIEYRHSAPPRAPNVTAGRDAIEAHLHRIAASGIELELSDEVLGDGRIAFRATCTLPGGDRIVEHVILHLDGDLIARQVDVEASDSPR